LVVREAGVEEHLERGVALEVRLLRLVDDAHAAAAHLAEDLVGPEAARRDVADDPQALGVGARLGGELERARGAAAGEVVLDVEPGDALGAHERMAAARADDLRGVRLLVDVVLREADRADPDLLALELEELRDLLRGEHAVLDEDLSEP